MVLTWLALAQFTFTEPSFLVHITGNGIVFVDINSTVVPGVNELPVPVPAIPETILVEVDGTPVPPVYYNETIYVFSNSTGVAHISYIANVSEVRNGVYSIDIVAKANITLVVDKNVILLNIPRNIYKVDVMDGTLRMVIEGPERIVYTLKVLENVTTIPIGTVKQPGSREQVPPAATRPKEAENRLVLTGFGVTLLAVLALLTYLLARRRHSKEAGRSGTNSIVSSTTGLTDVDEAIIAALRRAGGRMRQPDLIREVGFPRTTVLRHIRKLERSGVVRVVKGVDGANVVILVDSFRETGDAP